MSLSDFCRDLTAGIGQAFDFRALFRISVLVFDYLGPTLWTDLSKTSQKVRRGGRAFAWASSNSNYVAILFSNSIFEVI